MGWLPLGPLRRRSHAAAGFEPHLGLFGNLTTAKDERQGVMCQEFGHTYGLDHQDEDRTDRDCSVPARTRSPRRAPGRLASASRRFQCSPSPLSQYACESAASRCSDCVRPAVLNARRTSGFPWRRVSGWRDRTPYDPHSPCSCGLILGAYLDDRIGCLRTTRRSARRTGRQGESPAVGFARPVSGRCGLGPTGPPRVVSRGGRHPAP